MTHDKLPNSLNLFNHHIIKAPGCSLCGEIDDQFHIFLECKTFVEFRNKNSGINWENFNIIKWISSFNDKTKDLSTRMAFTFWHIWIAKNEAIFQNKPINIMEMIRNINESSQHFKSSFENFILQSTPTRAVNRRNIEVLVGWTPSQKIEFKLNMDGVASSSLKNAGIGAIIRNSKG